MPACQEYASMLLSDNNEKYFSGVDLLALGMAKLLLAAYENQCLIDDKVPVFTLGTFVEYVEETLVDAPNEAERIVKVFTDSRYTKVMVDKAQAATEEAEKKKQLIGNSLNPMHSTNSASHKNNSTHVPFGNLNSGNRVMKGNKSKKEKRKKK